MKHGANRLAEQLEKPASVAMAIHGNKSQGRRTKALADFKAASIKVLVATDIAARGIDIDQLPHVVNFRLPRTCPGLRAPHRPHRPHGDRGRGRGNPRRHAPQRSEGGGGLLALAVAVVSGNGPRPAARSPGSGRPPSSPKAATAPYTTEAALRIDSRACPARIPCPAPCCSPGRPGSGRAALPHPVNTADPARARAASARRVGDRGPP